MELIMSFMLGLDNPTLDTSPVLRVSNNRGSTICCSASQAINDKQKERKGR